MNKQALDTLREKLSFFEVEHAKTADPEQKFALQQRIAETRAEIKKIEEFSEASPPVASQETSAQEALAARLPWYKDPHWVVPIVVALIGLVGVLIANKDRGSDVLVAAPDGVSVNLDSLGQEDGPVRVIPLDTPIYLSAEVPAGTVRATVKYASQPLGQGPLDIAPDCTIRSPGVDWSAESAREPKGAAVSWTLGLPEANRFYAFCFGFEKKLTEEQLYSFLTRAQDVLDVGLGQVQSANITVSEAQQICAELRGNLLAATKARRIATPGTLFDCDSAQVGAFAIRIGRGVLLLQRRIAIILAGRPASGSMPGVPSFAERQEQLQEELSEIQDIRALPLLFDLLKQLAAKDAVFGARVRNLCPDCAALVGPTATPARMLAFGVEAEEPRLAPIASNSDSAQVEARGRSYLATASGLKDMRNLLVWALEDSNPVRKLLEADELRALASLMKPDGLLAAASARASILAGLCRSLAPKLAARRQELSAGVEAAAVGARDVYVLDLAVSNNYSTRRSGFRWPFS